MDMPWDGMASVDLIRMIDESFYVLVASPWVDGSGKPVTGEPGNCRDMRKEVLKVFISHDAGQTWESTTLARPAVFAADIDFFGKKHGIISISKLLGKIKHGTDPCAFQRTEVPGHRILTTHDGGHTWRQVLTCPGHESCQAVAMPSPNRILIGSTSGRILVSRDGGRYFNEHWLGEPVSGPSQLDPFLWIQDFDFVDRHAGYVLTNGRGIWKTTDGGDEIWYREASPMEVPGFSVPGFPGEISAPDLEHALAGGPSYIVRRVLTP
jgi:hypothetical protein